MNEIKALLNTKHRNQHGPYTQNLRLVATPWHLEVPPWHLSRYDTSFEFRLEVGRGRGGGAGGYDKDTPPPVREEPRHPPRERIVPVLRHETLHVYHIRSTCNICDPLNLHYFT